MSKPQRKRALILRAFNDAGTGEAYEADATVMMDAGAFANYEAAGLVSAPDEPKGNKRSAPRARRRGRKSAAQSTAKAPETPVVEEAP